MLKYSLFASSIFLVGLLGLSITRKNIIIILMCVELMLLGVNINFIVFSVYLDDAIGAIFSLFVLTVAAAESAIGLAILVVYYRVSGTIGTMFIKGLKG
jgi:NADH:ubiquinone oxidoreductase subunit K